jgi:hypothetical protein
MKLPSFTITALISAGNILSMAQNYAFVDAATAKAHQPKKKEAPKPKEEQKEERTLDEMRSILRKKIKTMTELRMKTVGLRRGHLRLTGRKCTLGVGKGDSYTDVGVLSCELDTHYCLEDLLSSTGGVCAEVVSGDEADGSEKVAGDADVSVEGVVPGDMAEVGSEDEASTAVGTVSPEEDVIGDVIDGPAVSAGGLDVDEDAAVNQIAVVKLLTVKDKMKLEYLHKKKLEAGESIQECTPQSNGDFIVDGAGILSGCENSSHVCMPDASSYQGGTCLDIEVATNDVEGGFKGRDGSRRYLADHLIGCVYGNGTVGFKCDEPGACGDLQETFIQNSIGCGSCRGYGACTGLTGKFVTPYILSTVVVLLNISYSSINLESSSVGESSCNAGNACRFDDSLGERTVKPRVTLFFNSN